MKKMKKKPDLKRIIGIIVLITLIISIVYSLVRMSLAPDTSTAGEGYVKVKSDYTLMLVQCVLGLLVLFLPDILNHKLSLRLPNYFYILYYLFLYCAIYLGEVRDFYYRIPNWDSILHAFSGILLGCVGFALVNILNDAENVRLTLSPGFIALFAFCFALAAGTVWEIYEFTGDHLLGMNMQKFRLQDGTELVGHNAVYDTMMDLIIDGISAAAVTLVGYLSMKRKIFVKYLKKKK